MYATVPPTHLVATVGLHLQPFLNCRVAVADVTADPIPDRSFASVSPPIERFDRNTEHLGQLRQSHQPLDRFLDHDHLPFPSGCVGGSQVEAPIESSTLRHGRLLSSHTGRTDGWFTAEPVDNRCRCKSPQTSEGGQPLVAVTLLQNLLQRGFVSPSALKRSLSRRGHPGCSRHRSSANPPSASALRYV